MTPIEQAREAYIQRYGGLHAEEVRDGWHDWRGWIKGYAQAIADATPEKQMPLVIVESPYAGDIERNVAYARAALADCLRRGEAPIASHLLYTQPGVLDDGNPDERALGIEAGLQWGRVADMAVFYVDIGWSPGMEAALVRHKAEGRAWVLRHVNEWHGETEAA